MNYYVSIVKGNSRKQILEESIHSFDNYIPNISGRIVIKPNFLSANNLLASITPEALEIVLKYFRSRFPQNSIYVAEGSHVSDVYFKKYHIQELADKYGATLFSIDKDETNWKEIEFDDLCGNKCKARISRLYSDANYVVSLTVPKTHANIGVSLSMKNFVGILHPDDRPKFHGLSDNVPNDIKELYKRRAYDRDDRLGYYLMKARGILPVTKESAKNIKLGGEIVRKNLFNLYSNIQPDLCIIDGYDGMEGNGPWHGDNAKLRTAIVGNNCVVTDLTACKIMGQPLEDIGYTNYINNLSEFINNTVFIGSSIDDVKKKLKPHKFEPYL